MRKLVTMILPLSLFAISGFAQDVRYNFDSGANFAQYKTYKWVEIKGAQAPNEMVDQQIKSAFDAELAKKGLTKAGDAADLLIGYQISISQEKEFTSYSTDFGYGPGWGRGWYGGGMGSTTTTGQTTTINIGAVGVDMYDASGKKLVWRGVATKTLDEKAKPEKRQKNLAKGVEKLLKNYPPKPKA
jgi:hypothetical protein